MASLTWWTWVWVNSGSWWWTGRPGVLQFMGSQRADTTEWLNWTELKHSNIPLDYVPHFFGILLQTLFIIRVSIAILFVHQDPLSWTIYILVSLIEDNVYNIDNYFLCHLSNGALVSNNIVHEIQKENV